MMMLAEVSLQICNAPNLYTSLADAWWTSRRGRRWWAEQQEDTRPTVGDEIGQILPIIDGE